MTRALVLAAGRSTRIRTVAGERPKPLLAVGGRTALEWNLCWLAAAGIREVWINLHYRGDLVRAHAGNGERFGLHVRYSEEEKLLGTAGAIRRLEPELAGADFLVLYGDNVTRGRLDRMIRHHGASSALATLAVFDQRTTPNSGIAGGRVVLDPEDRVTELHEGREHPSPFVSAGVCVFAPAIFAELPPDGTFADLARDIFPALLQQGRRICAYRLEDFCFGLDTPAAYERAQRHLGRHPLSQSPSE